MVPAACRVRVSWCCGELQTALVAAEAVEDDRDVGVLVGVDPQDAGAVHGHVVPLALSRTGEGELASDRTLEVPGKGPYRVTARGSRAQVWTPDQRAD